MLSFLIGFWMLLQALAQRAPGRALERQDPSRHLPAGANPAQVDFPELCRRANVLAKAHTVIPKPFHDNPQAIVFVGMRGAELGFSLGYSIENIDIIEGKAVPNAQARLTVIRRDGHDARWGTSNASEATLRVRRKEFRDDPDAWVTYTYTIEDAIRAELATLWVERKYRNDGDRYDRTEKYVVGDVINGLDPALVATATAAAEADCAARLDDGNTKAKPNLWVKREVDAGRIKSKDNWRKDPPAMLRARCITTISRMEFSDVMAGHAINPYEEPADERGADDELGPDFSDRIEQAAGAAQPHSSVIDVEALYEDEDDDKPDPDEIVVELEDQIAGGGGDPNNQEPIPSPPAAPSAPAGEPSRTSTEATGAEPSAPAGATHEPSPRAAEPDPSPVDDPGTWDADRWKKEARSRKVKIADVIRKAIELAREAGEEPPVTLEELIANPTLCRGVFQHLERGL